jgi:hypothetical protein
MKRPRFGVESKQAPKLEGRFPQPHAHGFEVFLQVLESGDHLAVVAQGLGLAVERHAPAREDVGSRWRIQTLTVLGGAR